MAQARPQAPIEGELRYQLLPYLPPQLKPEDLAFLDDNATVARLIRVIDELEQQRQGTAQQDDKRYRKKLLQTHNLAHLLPILKRFSFSKSNYKYYLIHDGEKQNAHMGKGGSGTVKYGINLLTKELVAVKILTECKKYNAAWIKYSGEDEAKRLAKVDQLLGAFSSTSPTKGFQFHIIQKLARGNNLHALIQSPTRLYEKIHVFLMICKSINDLHKRGLVHGDISRNNILYNAEDASVKLVDYGKSCELIAPEAGYKQIPWSKSMKLNAAPETIEPIGIFSKHSDVFNLGRDLAYLFDLLDDEDQLLNNLTYNKKNSIETFELYYCLHLIVKEMIAPKANKRISLSDVMLQAERLKRRATNNLDIRDAVGIVNLEKYDPATTTKLITDLNKLKITRVILIDTSTNNINNNHIALMQLLKQHKIAVAEKIYFTKAQPEILEKIIAEHLKLTGILFDYFYIDSQTKDLIDSETEDQLHQFNDEVAQLYQKVMKFKHQKRLRNEIQLQALKNDINILSEECTKLKAKAQALGQTDLIIEKMVKTLTNMCKPPKARFEEQRKKTNATLKSSPHIPPQNFFLYSSAGFLATVYYNINGNFNKIEGISTRDVFSFISDTAAITKYRGPLRPLPEAYSVIPPHFKFKDDHRIPQADIDNPQDLLRAAIAGDTDVVVQYINKHCKTLDSAKNVSVHINCALLHAADQGHYAIVTLLLLTLGIDVNFKGHDGSTALHFAACRGDLNIVNVLLSHGANVNIVNDDGDHPLINAAHNGHAKVVKALVAAGSDVNLINKEGYTALTLAALGDHVEVIVELLKAQNLNLNIKAVKVNKTALEIAASKRNLETFYLLHHAASAPALTLKLTEAKRSTQPITLNDFNTSKAGIYERLHVAFQLCKTVEELHARGIVHGDLNVYTIMYNPEDGTIKLQNSTNSSQISSPEFGFRKAPAGRHNPLANRENAPEVFDPKGIYSVQSDIFNLGRIMCYTFCLLVKDFQLPDLHSDDYKNMSKIAEYELHTAIHVLVKRMLSPIASRRPSLKEIMLELEKFKRRVSVNPSMREEVAIIDLEKYLLDPNKKNSYHLLIEHLKEENIKRVILIDPYNVAMNDEHTAFLKLLEKENIIVSQKIVFKKATKEVIADIIEDHFKTMGIVFDYFYDDFDYSDPIKTDIADKVIAYNNKLAMLYSQVMNLKHRRKLLSKSQSLNFKQQSTALSAECADLKKLAKDLGQSDFLLKKIEKTLKNIRKDNIRSIVPLLFLSSENQAAKENSPNAKPTPTPKNEKFILASKKDGFFASVHSLDSNSTKKVDCIFSPDGTCVYEQKELVNYRGPVKPIAKVKVNDKDLQTIVKHAKDTKPSKPYNFSQLINAAKMGDLEIVLQFIEDNRSILTSDDKVSAHLSMALQWAANEGHYQLVTLLITTPGVNINYMGTGDTPLMYAATDGYLDIVKALIAQGADVNLINRNGNTALTFAAIGGCHKIVKTLIAAGADINHCNKGGENALLLAAKYGFTEVVVELVKAPTLNPTIKEYKAWKVAREKNYLEILNLLSDGIALTPAKPITRRAI